MRIALGVHYNGASYYGWQRQQNVPSIAQHIEEALSQVANQPIEVQCAGRTDAGVHATGQVIHFDTTAERPHHAWVLGTNAHLPPQIAIQYALPVLDDFHARFSATARQYRYVIYNQPVRSGILAEGVTWHKTPLDEQAMHAAAQSLLGEHDFTSFRAAQCQSNSPCRYVHHVLVKRVQDYVIVDIKANAFLHHMVRNIVGALLWVGEHAKPVAWLKDLLEQRNRQLAAPTAKAHGLYFVDVTYPAEFQIPKLNKGPLFLDLPS
jgi:tRNA pseudouridine38-40 synthase